MAWRYSLIAPSWSPLQTLPWYNAKRGQVQQNLAGYRRKMPVAQFPVIRFPSAEERQRALRVFLDVPATRLVLPGHDMAVTREHIQALEREYIAFE